jgi:tetratricopeptide (TPR) repeat protein
MSPEQPSSKIGKSVGERLRAARIAQHFTQSQLAAPDFSVSYISAIERGQIHPSLRALEILAGRLGLTSTQLLPSRNPQDERLGVTATLSERDEDEIEYILLEAQLLITQGRGQEALTLLEQCAGRRLKRQQQLKQRFLQGLAHYRLEQYQESEFMLAEAEKIAKELNAPYLYQSILDLLAATYSGMRNAAQALQAHQRCLALLEGKENVDPFFLMHVYISIGQHYTRLDNNQAAIETFHKALALADTLKTRTHIQEMYTRLSRQYATEKEYDLATLYAYKSAQVHNQQTMKRSRSELYHYLGHAIMQQDAFAAHEFIEETLQKPGIQQDPLARASLLTRRAEWLSTQQEANEEATHDAHLAQELAEPLGDSIIAAEALIILGRCEYALQHYEEGSQHFIAGLDMLERLGSHEELADESVRYAQLLEDIGQPREAFTHFRRAFQSRQKLGK